MSGLDLPQPLLDLMGPVIEAYPLESTMSQLVVQGPVDRSHVQRVEGIVGRTDVAPAVEAGLWLYVDELDLSHGVSRNIDGMTGSFWHGIMHRRDGDFSNSHYWFRRVGHHPAMEAMPDYDPHVFIDAVARWSEKRQGDAATLVRTQRREWMALFHFCLRHPDDQGR